MSEYTKESRGSFKGKRGEVVVRGDRVAAAIREGNSADLRIGVVQDIYYAHHEYMPARWRVVIQFEGMSRTSTMENLYNITKLDNEFPPPPRPDFDYVEIRVKVRDRKLSVTEVVDPGQSFAAHIYALHSATIAAQQAIEGKSR